MDSIKPGELEKLVAAGRRMYEGGLATGATGAMGVRLADGGVAVTAAGTRIGFLARADLLVMNGSGPNLSNGRKPGKEAGIIRAVLGAQAEAGSVVKVNSPYATALAHKGPRVLERSSELLEDLGGVAYVPYFRPGTAGLAGAVAEAMRSNRVAIIEGQGAIVSGSDIDDAIDRAESLEAAARVIFILIGSNGA
ncbi:MAG TPA: class II aldolase/adducin family protein [Candidatus Anoxymicrobiaceae bacterium]|jgi:ribulose-5-phosphate 4-epimerase/fuculose-1-phosphate aldolase